MTESEFNILIRVNAEQARSQIASMRAELASLSRTLRESNRVSPISAETGARAAAATTAIAGTTAATRAYATASREAEVASGSLFSEAALLRMRKTGSEMQWTGRQLSTNFTAPIMLAAGETVKWELANEKAFTNVQKFYGDTGQSAETLNAEIGGAFTRGNTTVDTFSSHMSALGQNFEALSNHFGVAQKDVIGIAETFAAAGSSGVALSKAVQLTLETMSVGGQNAADAAKGLISIQAQYGLSADGLTSAIQDLNAQQKITALELPDMITAFQRAGGTARTAGIDIDHLGALITALVPNAATASSAGDGLKTMIERIAQPTATASAYLKQMGIDVNSIGYISKPVTQRIEEIAGAFQKLSGQQQIDLGAKLSGLYQVSKFDTLMRDVALSLDETTRANSDYGKSLDTLKDKAQAQATWQSELERQLKSNPQMFKQVMVSIQNTLSDAIIPLIPWLLYMAQSFEKIVAAFGHLNPSVQKFILFAALLIAAVGPLVVIFYSFNILISEMGTIINRVYSLITGPFRLAMRLMGLGAQESAATTKEANLSQARSFEKVAESAAATAEEVKVAEVKKYTSVQEAAFKMGASLTTYTTESAVKTAEYARESVGMYRVMADEQALVTDEGYYKQRAIVQTHYAQQEAAAAAAATKIIADQEAEQAAQIAALESFETIKAGIIAQSIADNTAVLAGQLAEQEASQSARLASMRAYETMKAEIAAMGTSETVAQSVLAMTAQDLGITEAMIAQADADAAILTEQKAAQSAQLAQLEMFEAIKAEIISISATDSIAQSAIAMAAQDIGIAEAQAVQVESLMSFESIKAGITAGAYATKIEEVTTGESVATVEVAAAQAAQLEEVVVGQAAQVEAVVAAQAAMDAAVVTGGEALVAATAVVEGEVVAEVAALPEMIGGALAAVVGVITSPFWIAIAAVAAILIMFRDQIKEGISNVIGYFSNLPIGIQQELQPLYNMFDKIGLFIQSVFNLLPDSVRSAMRETVQVVVDAAKQVYEAFSYINPFARHSPSLVDNVQNGMGAVGDHFGAASDTVQGHLDNAHGAMEDFGQKTAAFTSGQQIDISGDQGEKLGQAGASPDAIRSYQDLAAAVANLKGELAGAKQAVEDQKQVVADYTEALKNADAVLKDSRTALKDLSDQAADTKSQLDAAKSALSQFASAPIEGMRAFGDAIFANTMAQKQLELQMLDMQNQPGYVTATQHVANLNAEIDKLVAKQSSLRSAGAGSDITGQFDSRIAGLSAQRDASTVNAGPLAALTTQLAQLKIEAQRLNLTESLKFDPLKKQVSDLVVGMKELPFDQIVAGVTRNQAAVTSLTAAYAAQKAAVDAQQKVVDGAQTTRDAASAALDVQKQKASELSTAYNDINQTIKDGSSALRAMSSQAASTVAEAVRAAAAARAAAKVKKEKGPSAASIKFANDALGGQFPTVSGLDANGKPLGALGREGGDASQAGDIQALTDKLKAGAAGFDPFQPIKDAWAKVVEWWGSAVVPVFHGLLGALGGGAAAFAEPFGGLTEGGRKFMSVINTIRDTAGQLWAKFKPGLEETGNRLMPHIVDAAHQIENGLKGIWEKVAPELDKLKQYWPQMLVVLGVVAAWFGGPILGTIGSFFIAIVGGAMIVVHVLSNVLGPIFNWIGSVIAGVIEAFTGVFQALKGLANVIMGIGRLLLGIFTLNGAVIKEALQQILQGFTDTFEGIYHFISGILTVVVSTFVDFGKVVWGVISGIVTGIIDFFVMLYDVLLGHSIIPDIVNGAVRWFIDMKNWVFEHVAALYHGVVDFFNNLWNDIVRIVTALVNGIVDTFVYLKNRYVDITNAIHDAIVYVWNNIWGFMTNIVSNIVDWVVGRFDNFKNNMVNIFNFVSDVIGNIWNGIGNAIRWVVDNVVGPAFNAMVGGVNWVKDAFSNAVGAIGGIWDSLKRVISDPVSFIVNTVYDGGIQPAFNAIADVIGLPGLPRFNFADGGAVFGAGGPRDDKILAMLSNGEHVIPADEVAMAGGQGGIMRLREMIRSESLPKFAWGGAVGGFVSGLIGDIVGALRGTVLSGYDLIANSIGDAIPNGDGGPDNASRLPKDFFNTVNGVIRNFIGGKADTKEAANMAANPGGGAEQWRGLVDQILAMKGLPIGTDNGVLHIIDMESSGNPNAINLTDSNAVAGYPSQGLMQTIPQTFAAYAGEFAGRGITDPFANIYAGISYAVANYGLSWLASGGNTSAAGGYIGYDEGGWLNHASAGFNMSGKPEPVFTSAQWAILSGNLQMEQTILDSVRSLSTSSIKDTVVDVLTATLAARITTPAATTERQGDINYNITVGSVTMPNIRSGSDAKAFVSNLRDMAN